MGKVMERIFMNLIPLMKIGQEVIEVFFLELQVFEVFHVTEYFLDEWFQELVVEEQNVGVWGVNINVHKCLYLIEFEFFLAGN